MNPLVEKVLKSGLIDKATAELMERQGFLPEGASEEVDETALEGATKEKLVAITEQLAEEVEREHTLKETYLDLERLRWPVSLRVIDPKKGESRLLSAVIDRQGRYYFRFQDIDPAWFVPGYKAQREDRTRYEVILEVSPLYIEDKPVALQVTTEEIVE